jgi:hypothetical protein
LSEFDKANVAVEGVKVKGEYIDGIAVSFKSIITAKKVEINGESFNLNVGLVTSYIGSKAISVTGCQKQGKDAIYIETERLVCTNGLKIKIRTLVSDEVISRQKELQKSFRNTKNANTHFLQAKEQIAFLLANEANIRAYMTSLMKQKVPLKKEELIKILMHNSNFNVYDKRGDGKLNDNFYTALDTYNREERLLGYEKSEKSSSLWLGANSVNGLYGADTPKLSNLTFSEVEKYDVALWDYVAEATTFSTQSKWVHERSIAFSAIGLN